MSVVALIGAGAMGAPMARAVRRAGHRLTVCDLDADTLATFGALGVTVTSRPSECASADIVLVVVANGDQVDEVLLGPDGVLAGAARRAAPAPLVAMMSTIGPERVVELDRRVRAAGARFLDAPISGGTVRAQQRTLAMLVGGGAQDLETARPVLEAMGSRVFHCGPVGAAQRVKLLNNVIGSVNTVMVAEAYRVALGHGLDPRAMTEVFDAGTGRSWLSGDADELRQFFQESSAFAASFESQLAIMRKDFALARGLVPHSEQKSFPVLDVLLSLLEPLGDETLETWRVVGTSSE